MKRQKCKDLRIKKGGGKNAGLKGEDDERGNTIGWEKVRETKVPRCSRL